MGGVGHYMLKKLKNQEIDETEPRKSINRSIDSDFGSQFSALLFSIRFQF